MTTPIQLLDAIICSDEVTEEVSFTLLCMVAAVDKVGVETTFTLLETYARESDVRPIARVLHAVDEFNLWKSATRNKVKLKYWQVLEKNASLDMQEDLERLLHSTSRVETQSRLKMQLETLKLEHNYALISILPPRHLQIITLDEDPLEFRRNTNGVAQVWGRNVLGKHYAPKIDPLRYLNTQSVPDIYKRMKQVVREDLCARNSRRVAALNAKERERKKFIESLGILSLKQQA